MESKIFLESDIEIQNQSNVCLIFRTAEKIKLKGVVNIEKFSTLLKLKRIIAFICRLIDNLKLRKSNTHNKIQLSHILQPRELRIDKEIHGFTVSGPYITHFLKVVAQKRKNFE